MSLSRTKLQVTCASQNSCEPSVQPILDVTLPTYHTNNEDHDSSNCTPKSHRLGHVCGSATKNDEEFLT